MNRPFIKGLDLSETFYDEAVKPILATRFPDLKYSAGRLGYGSDVLGFDTPQSMDHDWGPKFTLFLAEGDYKTYHEQINEALKQELPYEIYGYPTNFGCNSDGTTVMQASDSGPVNHQVAISTVKTFFEEYLHFDPANEPEVLDWLTFPQQHLRTIAAGRIFHDGLGQLKSVQSMFRFYPPEVWLYLLAVQWGRISQEEPFTGRCGQVEDDLGSALVAARLVRDVMNLCFLLEQQYAPYIKWFGTAFAQLNCAGKLSPILSDVLQATSWQEREKYLSMVYEVVATMHNDLGLTKPLPTQVSSFHGRPFLVIHGDTFADAIRTVITDERVRALPEGVGAIDQFVDSTDVLSSPAHFSKIKSMYRKES
jgi:hypothetical protein